MSRKAGEGYYGEPEAGVVVVVVVLVVMVRRRLGHGGVDHHGGGGGRSTMDLVFGHSNSRRLMYKFQCMRAFLIV